MNENSTEIDKTDNGKEKIYTKDAADGGAGGRDGADWRGECVGADRNRNRA